MRSALPMLAAVALAGALCAQTPQPAPQNKPAPPPAIHAQRQNAGQWLKKYKDVPPAEQEKALAADPKFQKLPKAQQDQLRERLKQFDNLPPAGKARLLNRMQAFEKLTPDQRQQARDLQQQFRALPQDRREQVRIAVRNLRALPPDARENEMNTETFQKQFSDNERDIMHKLLALPTPANKGSANPPAVAPH